MADQTFRAIQAADMQRGQTRSTIDLARAAGDFLRELIGHSRDGTPEHRQRRQQQTAAIEREVGEVDLQRDRHRAVSGMGGDATKDDDQIAAFYNDIRKYTYRYNTLPPEKRKATTIKQYIYIKHHDGPNSIDFDNSEGKNF
jgi:hypothetical protein